MLANKKILVYADWHYLKQSHLIGILNAETYKGKEEFYFEYSKEWINSGFPQMLDPDLKLNSGLHYLPAGKTNFGVFLDSSPDRWGETLMRRREALLARKEKRKEKHLLPSDFLLGVNDEFRSGALRFKLKEDGPFLNNNIELAAPSWASLGELENASLKFEEDNTDDPYYIKWINMLITPGSSLGGARPKAGIIDPQGNPWIAKFPSLNDKTDIGAWEMVVNELAKMAWVNVADGMLKKINGRYHTFLSKRFDRHTKSERMHFASAMTVLGHTDGRHEASYLELAQFIINHGANTNDDLEELWRRIVFNICVKNTDDHLRNHGFLLTERGWVLSPAYDLNPVAYGNGLSLNITENDNSLSLDLAMEVAEYFRLSDKKAHSIIKKVRNSVSNWRDYAKKYHILKSEQDYMAEAFMGKNA